MVGTAQERLCPPYIVNRFIGASGNSCVRTDIRTVAETKRLTERGSSDTSSTQDRLESSTDRAAPSAFLHHPRHHHRRRLCLAQGCQLAGGAARSQHPGPGYPWISRIGKRLHRK